MENKTVHNTQNLWETHEAHSKDILVHKEDNRVFKKDGIYFFANAISFKSTHRELISEEIKKHSELFKRHYIIMDDQTVMPIYQEIKEFPFMPKTFELEIDLPYYQSVKHKDIKNPEVLEDVFRYYNKNVVPMTQREGFSISPEKFIGAKNRLEELDNLDSIYVWHIKRREFLFTKILSVEYEKFCEETSCDIMMEIANQKNAFVETAYGNFNFPYIPSYCVEETLALGECISSRQYEDLHIETSVLKNNYSESVCGNYHAFLNKEAMKYHLRDHITTQREILLQLEFDLKLFLAKSRATV